MLRYLTAGESHGPALVAILEGMPSNVPVVAADINIDLRRRMGGYGRGGRMKIEQDEVEILGGVRHGKTLGSPISLMVRNRDWENWKEVMAANGAEGNSESARRALTRDCWLASGRWCAAAGAPISLATSAGAYCSYRWPR